MILFFNKTHGQISTGGGLPKSRGTLNQHSFSLPATGRVQSTFSNPQQPNRQVELKDDRVDVGCYTIHSVATVTTNIF